MTRRKLRGALTPLTPREIETLFLLSDGLFYQEIADRMGISIQTTKNNLWHAYEKLGAHNGIQALRAVGLLGDTSAVAARLAEIEVLAQLADIATALESLRDRVAALAADLS